MHIHAGLLVSYVSNAMAWNSSWELISTLLVPPGSRPWPGAAPGDIPMAANAALRSFANLHRIRAPIYQYVALAQSIRNPQIENVLCNHFGGTS